MNVRYGAQMYITQLWQTRLRGSNDNQHKTGNERKNIGSCRKNNEVSTYKITID